MPGIQMIALQQELEDLFKDRADKLIFLFKHSTRCPASARAYREYQDFISSIDEQAPVRCAMIRVIEERPLSDWVARTFGVKHESPQLLVVSGGRVLWQASRYQLTKDAMQKVFSESL